MKIKGTFFEEKSPLTPKNLFKQVGNEVYGSLSEGPGLREALAFWLMNGDSESMASWE